MDTTTCPPILEAAYEQQSLLKKRVELMRVDERGFPRRSLSTTAAPQTKAKPVRWLIVVMTSIVAVAAAFLGMLAWDTSERAQSAV